MTQPELIGVFERQFAECLQEMGAKNPDYSGIDVSQDALGNFKEAAVRAGITTAQAWLVFFNKHVMAIERFARTGRLSSETIQGRITDLINYLGFLRALVEDENQC
jgi:hypothetical protein